MQSIQHQGEIEGNTQKNTLCYNTSGITLKIIIAEDNYLNHYSQESPGSEHVARHSNAQLSTIRYQQSCVIRFEYALN